MDLVLFGLPDIPVVLEAIENLPYATMRAKLGRSGWVIMVLGRYERDLLHWISSDKITLVTRGGRLVRTAGLPEDLVGTNFVGDEPLARAGERIPEQLAPSRTIDLRPQNLFGIPVLTTLIVEGPRPIEISGQHYSTIQIREPASIELFDWEFENLVWVDAQTGFVWKSLQYISPDLPPVEMEILKPAS